MRRRKVLARSVRGCVASLVEKLESRTLLSSTLSEGLGTAAIQGVVYNDLDGSGQMDPGEPISADVVVSLSQIGVNYPGGIAPNVISDVNGNFSFTGLAAGQYQIRIAPQSGLVQDAPGVVDITVAAGAVASYNVGQTNNPNDGGSGGGSITGTLFNDQNQNGVYDATTEQFLGGDTVYLDLNGSGVLNPNDPQTTTNGTGQYTFNRGTQSIQSLTFASNTIGGTFVLDVSDSSVTPIVLPTATAPIVFDPNNAAGDALAIQIAINAVDPNGGVVVTPGADAFHYSVTYNLIGPQTTIATDPATALQLSPPTVASLTTTDIQDGMLTAMSMLPSIQQLNFGPLTGGGTFVLDFADANSTPVVTTVPTNAITFDPANTGGDNTSAIRNALSVLDPNGGITVTNSGNPFSYTITYALDGPQAPIKADPLTALFTASSPLSEASVQAGSGAVPTGVFDVRVVPRTGFRQDPPGYAQVTVYSDQTVSQNIGENNRNMISGIVYDDINGNGVQDPGDAPVAGEFVFLDLAGDGILFNNALMINNRGTFNASTAMWTGGDPFTTTDANGHFSFIGLSNGNYRVEIQSNAGMLMDNPLYTDADLGVGQDLVVNLPEGLPASVSGTIFDDKNANGVQDPGEPGVQDQTPFLDVNNDGVLEGNPIGTDGIPLWYAEPNTASSISGSYSLTDLGPGTYTLRFITPPSGLQTGPNNATHSYTFTLGSGTNLTGQNFGYQTPDLSLKMLKFPTKIVFAGTTLKASARVTNVGSLTAIGAAGINLYAQTSGAGLVTGTAVFIGTLGSKSIHLAPGQSKVFNLSFAYPTQTPTGTYFIYGLVVSNVHDNDSQNDLIGPIGPVQIVEPVIDLQNTYAAQPPTFEAPGQSIFLALAVTNNGNVTTSGEFAFRVYLTVGPLVEPTDVVVQTTFVKNVRIKPGKTRIFSVQVPYPGPNLGERFVIVNVDSGDALGELNLMNNFAVPTIATLFK